jgi:hypothetical protein
MLWNCLGKHLHETYPEPAARHSDIHILNCGDSAQFLKPNISLSLSFSKLIAGLNYLTHSSLWGPYICTVIGWLINGSIIEN